MFPTLPGNQNNSNARYTGGLQTATHNNSQDNFRDQQGQQPRPKRNRRNHPIQAKKAAVVKKNIETLATSIKNQILSTPSKPRTTNMPQRIPRRPGSAMPRKSTTRVSAPAAYGSIKRGTAPRIKPVASGGHVATNDELFATLTAPGTPGAFTIREYRVNPGLSSIFRWLSQIATGYDKYSFLYLRFIYEPITGTDTEGAVYLGWDPNVLEAVPSDKFQMSALLNSCSAPCWQRCVLEIPASKLLFIRRGRVAGSTLTSFDHGKFFIASSDTGTNTGGLGDIRVEYGCRVQSPHSDVSNMSAYSSTILHSATGTVSKTIMFGATAGSFGTTNIADLTTLIQTSGVVTFNLLDVPSTTIAGVEHWVLLITSEVTGTTVSAGAPTFSNGNSTASVRNFTTGAATGGFYSHTVDFIVDPSNLVMTYTVTAATVTGFQLSIRTLANTTDSA
jgi:hypothetical protein